MNQQLRIAWHGHAKKNSGSGVGAHFLILEELLKRGFEIDFFGRRHYMYPQELLKYKNFNYVNVKRHRSRKFFKTLPNQFQKIDSIINLFTSGSNMELFRQEILINHQIKKYDLLFFSNRYSRFRIEDVPSVAWAPGPPHMERYYNLQKLWKEIISIDGIAIYVKLLFFYAFKTVLAMPKVKNHDILICSSQWSKKQAVSYGFKPDIVRTLPFPMDSQLFKLNSQRTNKKRDDNKVFLWLGRSDPRKRLDLLLEAYALVLKERQDVRLKIFARFPYAKGYKRLIDRFKYPNHLEYQPFIDRLKVPELMAQCDFLIQPSEGEDFGSSVAEALCCGLPVIVGSTNGTKDYISSSSFVFKEYTPESLKETMIQAIEAVEQNREKLALDARETAEKNFSVYRIVDSLEEIFHESLKLYQPTLTKTSDKSKGSA